MLQNSLRLSILIAVTVVITPWTSEAYTVREEVAPGGTLLPTAPVAPPPSSLQEPYLGVIVAYDQRSYDGVFVPDLSRFPRQFVDFKQDFRLADKSILPGQLVTFKMNRYNEIWDLRLYVRPSYYPVSPGGNPHEPQYNYY